MGGIEPPAQRFERHERQVLAPLAARAPFVQIRELRRRVLSDVCIVNQATHSGA